MSRHRAHTSRRVVAAAVAIGLAATAFLFAGCSQSPTEQADGPWPAQVENVTPLSGGGTAIAMSDSAPLVFAAGRSWLLDDDGFAQEAVFSEEYMVVRDRAASAGVPYGGGAQSIGSRVCFSLTNLESVSDGEGIEQTNEYDELLLVDPSDPADRESVYRVPGRIDCAQTYESADGTLALIALDWSGTGERVLTLLARRGAEGWESVWSSNERDSTEYWVPMAYGFVSPDGTDDVFMAIVGDADDIPGIGSPSVAAVEPTGADHVWSTSLPDDLQHVETLNAFSVGAGAGVAFRYETGTTAGVMVAAPDARDLELHEMDGMPLHVFDHREAFAALVGPADMDTGPLDVVSLPGGERTRLVDESDAKWVWQLSSTTGASIRFALLGRHLASGDQASWSVTEARWPSDGGDVETNILLDSWDISAKFGGVGSLDELPGAEDGAAGDLVLWLNTGDEGSLATLPVQE